VVGLGWYPCCRLQPLPKRVLHRLRSGVSPFSVQYPFLSFRISSSCLRLFSRLPVTSSLNNALQKAVLTQHVTNPVSLPSLNSM